MSNDTNTYPYKHEGLLFLSGKPEELEVTGKYLQECFKQQLEGARLDFTVRGEFGFGVGLDVEIWSDDPWRLFGLEGFLIRTAVTYYGDDVQYLARF